MKHDDDYSIGHINLFAPSQNQARKPKSILKHTNYRTKNPPNKIDDPSVAKTYDDLNIRGYSSNIYRDDFTALKVESKEYLIPWNGDQSLLIDKYDCRLFLYDLSAHDADLIPNSARNAALSHEQNETETLCDFERYLDLAEEENHTEPGIEFKDDAICFSKVTISVMDQCDTSGKRGAAIGYVYQTDNAEQIPESNQQPVNQNEKLFNPDENLKLPPDMICGAKNKFFTPKYIYSERA
ncbi:splicing suppressor of white-apricot -like protein [Brachionus plicatilis]|uniref:Splicing suppressor of white-apricot-like protein n=1 Tax=Brachionus plicatilis TaxID=10195 RepID=A0A3M7SIX0_BRAPC|nr:splicing suppressor of white-apricot -like protein [Brachionus plicatilis]